MSLISFFALSVVAGVVTGMFLAYSYGNGVEDAGDLMPVPQTQLPLQDSGGSLVASSLIKDGSPFLGKSDAPVTIIEWGDYQCTYCFLFHNNGTLDHIKTHYVDPGQVRMIFKDFPLNGPDSALAAAASHCANDQSKYWEYHDILYQNWGGEKTGWITDDALYDFANQIRLDVSAFEECLGGQTYAMHVANLYASGRDIGIDATPSFLIFNDTHVVKIRGNQPLGVFVDAVDRLSNSPEHEN